MGGHEDMGTIHQLLDHRGSIRREVQQIEGGVRTRTESDDPAVAAMIKKHVHAMKTRVEDGRPIRRRDPLFAAIFDQADAIEMTIEETPGGVIVTETSDEPGVAALISAHAAVVSLFLENGHAEMRKNHAVPSPGP